MLESKNYIATDADIAKIARAIASADTEADSGRASYLKVLIATTQHELDPAAPVRVRTTKSAKLNEAETEKQLAALAAVHERFYSIILKETSALIGEGKGRAVEVNRLTNFARTALYSVRTWVRAGKDITSLAPARVTKSSLAVTLSKSSRPSGKVLLNRVELHSKSLILTIRQLAVTDKATAIEQMQSAMRSMSEQLVKLGGVSPRKIAPALKVLLRPMLASNGHSAQTQRSTLN